MKVLTKALIKRSEENAVNSGIFSFLQLMSNAGKEAAKIIDDKFGCDGKNIAVIAGNGNNGGDGFVIAKRLSEIGANVTVITPFGEPKTENSKYYFEKLGNITRSQSLDGSYDIVIDAIFGIGLNRELTQEAANVIDTLNNMNAVKVAVDIPSGVSADDGKVLGTAFMADFTVTFIALKPCFVLPEGSDCCGETVVADIGVKPIGYDYQTIEKPVFPKRKHNSHKGTFGTAVLYCGSYGMVGAAILSARAALRSGVGIAKCVLCDKVYAPFTCAVPEAVCVPIPDGGSGTARSDDERIIEALSGSKAALIGCGMGNNSDTENILRKLLSNYKNTLVIDADGINVLSLGINIIRETKAQVIITPHPGEMARLCGTDVKEIESNRIKYASEFAVNYGCVVVLKGANTIVALPDSKVYFNVNGNPGMSTGGSGDVLSGIIVSLCAQGFSASEAAMYGVYLHGEAGDRAADKLGERAMLPSDIISEL